MRPFDLISIIYPNIQNPLCHFVALALKSYVPSFINIRFNQTEKNNLNKKSTDNDNSPSQPITSEHRRAKKGAVVTQGNDENTERDTVIASTEYLGMEFPLHRMSSLKNQQLSTTPKLPLE